MALFKQNNSIQVFGVKEIQNMFSKLPKSIRNGEGKAWNAFWKENCKPMQKQAQLNANEISNKSKRGTGRLGRSIGFFTTKESRNAMGGYLGPRVKGRFAKKTSDAKATGKNRNKLYGKSGFYGAWVEFGSKIKFGGRGLGQDQPFMQPAFEATKDIVNANARRDAQKVMEKLIKRHAKRTEKFGILGR
tara:strand:+ start:958 stop:1524 length:567 start_codon:yes stop_codon:yes gene_type:complete